MLMPPPPADDPIDVVYTWVDDSWPGYRELLARHASTRHDVNPNRTRDNLQILKYSLRSLAAFAPWVRRVYLVTCRPQLPSWIDASAIRIVHHDEFMPREHLPTFNSFAILSNLHRLPDLARRFVYIEDDRLFGRSVGVDDFFDPSGRVRVYEALRGTPRGGARASGSSPWNLALARSNALLDERCARCSARWSAGCLRHRRSRLPMDLTCEQMAAFERDGFVIVRGAFTGEEAAAHARAIEALAAQRLEPGRQMVYYEDSLVEPGA